LGEQFVRGALQRNQRYHKTKDSDSGGTIALKNTID
jgi:hypothetical protein